MDEEKFIKGVQPKERMKGSGGIVYASCTSMLVAIETVFQTKIYIWIKSSSGIFMGVGAGGVFYVIVSLSVHKHTFDMIINFWFCKMC